jgi:hypothetical protein
MKKTCLSYIISVFLLFGCTIDDDDRCPDGYEYLPDQSICYEQVDGGDDLPPTDSGPDNFGDPCETDSDCSGGTAEYCLVSGGVGGGREGICSYLDCDSDGPECPAEYTCADCSQSGLPGFEVVVCMPDSMLESPVIGNACDW